MENTAEKHRIQKALCFITREDLQDKILERREKKILAQYYLLGETRTRIAKQFDTDVFQIECERREAVKKLFEYLVPRCRVREKVINS